MKQLKISDYFNRQNNETTRVVRLKKLGGKIIQGCDVYIGRACFRGGWNLKKSKWSNPFSVKFCGSHEDACKRYEKYLLDKPELLSDLGELVGKTLGCWCKPNPCHGDILVKLINQRAIQLPRMIIETNDEVLENVVQIPEIECDVSLEKNEKYCDEVKLPVHPSFYTKGILHLPDHKEYVRNLHFFVKKKDAIIKKFHGRWFSIWNCNIETGKVKFKVGYSLSSVIFGTSSGTVHSFGCNQDSIFLQKSTYYDF